MTPESLRLVQRRILRIQGCSPLEPASFGYVATGHDAIDDAIGGGLMRGCLHELFTDAQDSGCGAGFAGVLTQLLNGQTLWLREEMAQQRQGRLHAPGLAEIGVDPARLLLGILPDAESILRAAIDAMRCAALGTVVIELGGNPRTLDLTATRRLILAAEASGVTTLMLRVGGTPAPSAARTRWQIAPAPSIPLAANAPGHPAWEVALLRQRGRPDGGKWQVEWNRDRGELQEQGHDAPALSGTLVSLSADRSPGTRSAAGIRRTG